MLSLVYDRRNIRIYTLIVAIKILFKIRLPLFFILDIILLFERKYYRTVSRMKDYSKMDYFLIKNDVTSQALHSKEITADQERQLFRQNFTRDKKPYFALKHADSFIIVNRHLDKTSLVYAIRIRCELQLKFQDGVFR